MPDDNRDHILRLIEQNRVRLQIVGNLWNEECTRYSRELTRIRKECDHPVTESIEDTKDRRCCSICGHCFGPVRRYSDIVD